MDPGTSERGSKGYSQSGYVGYIEKTISNTELQCDYLRIGRSKASEVFPELHPSLDLKNTSVCITLPNGDLVTLETALSGPQATLNWPGKKGAHCKEERGTT